ncbi:MAG: GNAT family N-acetyltransferase [Promethearchaeota archaeon]
MFEKEDIKFLQELLMNSWPANHYYFINGWILRFTEGVTSRANSVFPLHYTGDLKELDKDIALTEKAYHAYELPTIFTISEYFEPSNLADKLLEDGYQQLGCITHTLIASPQDLRNEFINEEFTYLIISERRREIADFLGTYSKRDQNSQKILDALVNRIIFPQKRFIIAQYNQKIVGTLMGILDPHGFLYIADLLVNPDFRRKKIAVSMFFKIINEWAIPNGAKKIWLQVEIENIEAMNLYTKLGFENAYSYYYLGK